MRISLVVLAMLICVPGSAGTYKWVDEKGVTHYGDGIPPEYSNHGNQQLNKRGIVIKKTDPALTPQQRKAIEDENTARVLGEKKAAEQKRHDDALLLTYTSVDEIEQKKAREVQHAEFAISNLETQRKAAHERLNQQSKLKAAQADKPIPDQLAGDIAQSEQRLAWLEEQLASKRDQLAETREKHDAHKKRFSELRGAADGRRALPEYVVPATPDKASPSRTRPVSGSSEKAR